MAHKARPQHGPTTRLAASGSPLAIVNRPIKDLIPDPRNPRLHSKRQIQQIAQNIKAFGFNVPILVDAHGQVIAGHGRALAAPHAGLTEVPTICLDHLNEAQILAFMIADNRLTENATWDERLLGEQFRALAAVELDFNLEVTGFEMGEIDVLIKGLAPTPEGKEDPADALPDATARASVARPGDIWVLGLHRVLCGDALKPATYRALMDGRRAAAVFTDPPYNDPIDGYVTGFGKIHHPEFVMASGEMSETEYTEFLFTVFSHLVRNTEEGSLHYACADWRHLPEILTASRKVYSEFKNLCVWVKESGGQGSLYRSRHELVLVFKNGTSKHRNNIQLGAYGRYRTNIWEYQRVSVAARNGEEDLAGVHPTMKPTALVADAVMDCTARGDIVLDPFLGSGTTVIAAERTGRICYGMELEPGYVDTIVRRWQAFTGKSAVLAASGRAFDEIEEEMRHEQGR